MAARNGKPKPSKRSKTFHVYVPCRVEPGMFRGEYLVTFEGVVNHSKVPINLFADEAVVRIKASPARGKPVEGLLRAELLNRQNDLALLALPQAAQPVGERAFVKANILKKEEEAV